MSDTTYNVYRDGEKIASDLTATTYTDTGLSPNTSYDYQVSSENKQGESELSSKITVKTEYSPVESVTINKDTLELEVGQEENLQAVISPDTAKQNKKWSSEDAEIASVDSNGKVTAKLKGDTTVTVESDGKFDTSTVTVKDSVEITKETETEEIDVVEYETIRNNTEELPKGEEEVVQEGKNGYTKVTYEVTYEDGVETNKEETNRETIDPVDEIINVGTFEEPVPEPEPEE